MVRALVAIDSFKGCLSSAEANCAAKEGILRAFPGAEVVQIPVSDGGEGWLEAFQSAIGGEMVEVSVCDPLMRPIKARYLLQGDTAVIEMAQASGLSLLSVEERNPMKASSYGTGQLVVAAVRRGCRHIVVGLGGSATSDAGMGMLEAVREAFGTDNVWEDQTPLKQVKFTVATDVNNPLCGPEGAARVFAPQKGATVEMVVALDDRARQFADASAARFGRDCRMFPGAGAAGGLGYAFMQYLGAERKSGIELLLDAARFDELVLKSDLVVTGEGAADGQTLMGKLPYGIMRRARRYGVPVWLIAGRVENCRRLLDAGFSRVECINPSGLALEEAVKKEVAQANIRTAMQQMMSADNLNL